MNDLPSSGGDLAVGLILLIATVIGAVTIFGLVLVFIVEPISDYLSLLADRLHAWRMERWHRRQKPPPPPGPPRAD